MSGFCGQRLVNPERAIDARARKCARQNDRCVKLRALGEDRSVAIGTENTWAVLVPDHTTVLRLIELRAEFTQSADAALAMFAASIRDQRTIFPNNTDPSHRHVQSAVR
jgi:hypothetical protein